MSCFRRRSAGLALVAASLAACSSHGPSTEASDSGHPAADATHVDVATGDAGVDRGMSVVDAAKDVTVDTKPDADTGAQHDTGTTHKDTGPPGPTHLSGESIQVSTTSNCTNASSCGASCTSSEVTQTRTYDITIPVVCDASHLVPLVFIFHGDGGNGNDMYEGFPIEAAAAAAGGTAIFVYPDGLDDNLDSTCSERAWNEFVDPGCYPYSTVSDPTGNNDVDFFDAMVKKIESQYCVDTSKIWITGMSNGGYMSAQLARWRSGVVRATAPQSGAAPFGNTAASGCSTSDWTPPNYCVGVTKPVPAFIIHGTADTTVDPCNAVEDEAFWSMANQCQNASSDCGTTADQCTGSDLTLATPTSNVAVIGFDGGSTPCVASQGCMSGDPVTLCMIPGMGHSIWQDAPQVIWQFFSSL